MGKQGISLVQLILCQIVTIAIVVVGIWFSLPLHPNAPRIGYIDTGRLMEDFGLAKQNRTKIDSLTKDWKSKAQVLKDSLDAYMSTMGATFNTASAKDQQHMRAEIERRNQELAQFMKASQKITVDKEKELLEPTFKKINTFLKDYSEKEGYDVILGSTAGGNILSGRPRLDLTDRVIAELNKKYP